MTETDMPRREQPRVINHTKASVEGPYRIKVSGQSEHSGVPLTLAQLKSLVVSSTVTIEVSGGTITFAAGELGRAEKTGESYQMRNAQLSHGKRSAQVTVQLD